MLYIIYTHLFMIGTTCKKFMLRMYMALIDQYKFLFSLFPFVLFVFVLYNPYAGNSWSHLLAVFDNSAFSQICFKKWNTKQNYVNRKSSKYLLIIFSIIFMFTLTIFTYYYS